MYTLLGGEVPCLLLPKYPHHIQTGLFLPAGHWRHWREAGIAVVADRVRRLDPLFADFADRLDDFKPFVPLEGHITLIKEWARAGMLLIGDAAHTMSPAGAIGVNVALATAAIAAQELYPRLGHGPIAQKDLARVQHLRKDNVRTLHSLQLKAQRVLLAQTSQNPVVNWLLPKVLPLLVHSPLLPRVQRRVFVGAPLPPLDPACGFRA
jgi:2-polyprenyl-6-methoxyphenol hydroxylase-like FAD-dependent oxidoreductase